MSRKDEVNDLINIMNMELKRIGESGIELETHQVTNLILTNICQNLTSINLTLAIIADKLGGK